MTINIVSRSTIVDFSSFDKNNCCTLSVNTDYWRNILKKHYVYKNIIKRVKVKQIF